MARHEKFPSAHLGGEGKNAAGALQEDKIPPESVVIIRTSFIEMELFPSQLLPETAKELSTVPLGGQAITVGQDSNSGLREVVSFL